MSGAERPVILAGEQEPLDFGRGEGFAAGGLENNSKVKPLYARAGDLELGFDALEIATSTGAHSFQVEIAKDDTSRERGLMDRRYMAADRGMQPLAIPAPSSRVSSGENEP